jgi:hypothetical protein
VKKVVNVSKCPDCGSFALRWRGNKENTLATIYCRSCLYNFDIPIIPVAHSFDLAVVFWNAFADTRVNPDDL